MEHSIVYGSPAARDAAYKRVHDRYRWSVYYANTWTEWNERLQRFRAAVGGPYGGQWQ